MLYRLLNRFYQVFQETVFPPKCLVCQTFFRTPANRCQRIMPNAAAGGTARHISLLAQAKLSLVKYLCANCLAELTAVESPLCICCGIPFKSREGADHYCGACIASTNNFSTARAALVYDEIVTEIIHCYKYRGKIQLARPLGELLLTAFVFFWDKGSIDIILPVPLHASRIRQRGFNQAYLLIRNWRRMATRLFYDITHARIEHEVLVRSLPTAPQSTLGRAQRALNIKNAFSLVGDEAIAGKRILLVDDVYTTGATANECGRLLLEGGAQQVDVLTLARAV